jgi:hypothetical protein
MGNFNQVGEEVCLCVSTLGRVAEEKWGESKLQNFVITAKIY